MSINNHITFKFLTSLYLKLKEKRLNSLDRKIQDLKEQIEDKKKLFKQNTASLEKLVEEKDSLINEYHRMLVLLEKGNKTIAIRNNSYDVLPWENVYIKKSSDTYVIQTKRGQNIYVFTEDIIPFLDYLLTLNPSIIVLSVDDNRIGLQFRLDR